MNILVTGGAGYIGSHAVRQLLKANHSVIVLDDLSHGHRKAVEAASSGLPSQAVLEIGSLGDPTFVSAVLKKYPIDAVMHFAGFIEVGESVANPGKYYANNFSNSILLLQCMVKAGVKKIIFSSTAAVYGLPKSTPIQEEQEVAPINPYGRSKLMTEMAIQDFATAHGVGYVFLRYFNVAGASPDSGPGISPIGEQHEPESHLIPRVLSAAAGRVEQVDIYGNDYPTPDGTCIRDYIHVEDLVAAHLLASESIKPGVGEIYNLGSENGFSVLEVIRTCAEVTGTEIHTRVMPRRPGDPAILVASSEKIRKALGWVRKYPDLKTIVQHAWDWHQSCSNSEHRS